MEGERERERKGEGGEEKKARIGRNGSDEGKASFFATTLSYGLSSRG